MNTDIKPVLLGLALCALALSGCGGGGGGAGGSNSGNVGASGGTSMPAVTLSNVWTWTGGASTANASGAYGALGTAAAPNQPGARDAAASWIDASGKLWLFGGETTDANGNTSYLGDLWNYDPATQQWTWVSGSSAPDATPVYGTLGLAAAQNQPGARFGSVTWIDAAGKLWLFGGGIDANGAEFNLFNDLWLFDPVSKQWTWVSGSPSLNAIGVYGAKGLAAVTNQPGARFDAVSWMDSNGKLWLFGGGGYDGSDVLAIGNLNDLWQFDPLTREWTWISGSSTENAAGNYGKQGVAAVANQPGARLGAPAWVDSNGKFWLFGGDGYDAGDNGGALSDMWQFDPVSKQWIWENGPSVASEAGVYGTQGTAAALNQPGARGGGVGWRTASGKFCVFGGQGYDGSINYGELNDLWQFDPVTKQWTWISGASVITNNIAGGNSGVYGTLGSASVQNQPGGRYNAVAWADSAGGLWMFGGWGIDVNGVNGDLNDLWRTTVQSQ